MDEFSIYFFLLWTNYQTVTIMLLGIVVQCVTLQQMIRSVL